MQNYIRMPMIITDYQKQTLSRYIPDLEKLIEKGDVQALLDEIDNVIVDNILANNEEPDSEGIMLQRIYDQIFNQN